MHSTNQALGTAAAIAMMINCSNESINDRRINGVECNVIFLCKVETEMDRLDLKRDGLGVWEPGRRRTKMPYYNDISSNEASCDSYVWRVISTCKSYPALKRIEIYRKAKNSDGSCGILLSPVFVQYCFEGKLVYIVRRLLSISPKMLINSCFSMPKTSF